ncbi:hypothetical protein JDV02_010005 [Purpureocillium takamizusanense]|uniref:FAD-binding domain-containing protein n=1 Tax=Purpureocillium takamizusanense TaxID=2060973 RepID=A0A9Q8VGZ1_9HYPO|nr:uncharacterized protein JDV02_010005 [Purpureocillium takamizusanense]UNI24242.1 hypothetical protein JDV02_010005 [Purpureocillium takamizusanense]
MKIAIIGAGISGCTAYLLLKKHLPKPLDADDHSITIYEAYDTNQDTTHVERGQGPTHSSTLVVGGGLGVGANGLNVIKRLDENLLRDIVRGGYVVSTMIMKSKTGTVLARVQPSGDSESDEVAQRNMHMVSSSRHSLWKCLRVRIPDEAIVNRRISAVVANPSGQNTVSFADGGPSVEADLVIGADGLKSTAKRALFPEAQEDPFPPHYEGLVGVGGFIPAAQVREHVERGSMNFVFGGNGFFGYFFSESTDDSPHRDSPYHVSEPSDRLAWWSTYTAAEAPTPGTLDGPAVTAQLRARLQSWKDPVIQTVLQSLTVENMYPTWTVPPLPTWERDGVVLVGDAAHALPPTSGQGSSQALEDVEAFTLLLSHHLREAYTAGKPGTLEKKEVIKSAAKQYMELRLPRVTQMLKDSRSRQDSKRDKGIIEEYIMYVFMWTMGCFPGVMAKYMNKAFTYDVAEEVKKILGKGN